MLRHHVSRMRRNGRKLEEYFAYDSVALAMLARERKINIIVKHELLPEKYLEEIDIDYNTIEGIVSEPGYRVPWRREKNGNEGKSADQ